MTPTEREEHFKIWVELTISEVRAWQARIVDDLSLLEDSLVILRQVGLTLPHANKIIKNAVHIGHNRKILIELFNNLKEI